MNNINNGFTLMELMVVISVIAILTVATVPGLLKSIPDVSLRHSAQDLKRDIRLARSWAVKRHEIVGVTLNATGNSYRIFSYGRDGDSGTADDVTLKTVNLKNKRGGIAFGTGSATKDATSDANVISSGFDVITFTDDTVAFGKAGMREGLSGYVYMTNKNKSLCYAVGVTSVAGSVAIKRWGSSSWDTI